MCDHKVFVYLFKSSFMPLNAVFVEIYTEEIDFLKAEIDFHLIFFKILTLHSGNRFPTEVSRFPAGRMWFFAFFMLVLASYFLHFINIIGSRMLIGLKGPNP